MPNSIYYIVGTFLNAGIPFLFLPILTRVLSAEEYGALSLYMSIYAVTVPIVSIGVPQYAFRIFFDSKEDFHIKVSNALSTVLAWSVILLCILALVSCIIFTLNAFLLENIAVVVIIFISALLNVFYQMRLLLFNAEGKASSFVINQVLYTLIIFSVTLLSLYFIKSGIYSRVLGTLVSDFIFAFFAIRKLQQDFSISVKFSKDNLFEKSFTFFGFGLVPHLIASVLLSSVDKFIIAYSITLDELAGYAIAVQFTSILMIFTQGLSKEWSRFYLANRDNRKTVSGGTALISLIMILAVLAYLLKDVFLYLFVGEGYQINNEVIKLLLSGQVFHSIYIILCVEVTYLKKTHVLSSMTLVSLLVNVLVSLALVDSYGVIGVAIGTMTGMAAKFLAVCFFVSRSRKVV